MKGMLNLLEHSRNLFQFSKQMKMKEDNIILYYYFQYTYCLSIHVIKSTLQ